MIVFQNLDGANFFRFILAALIVLGGIRFVGASLDEYERRTAEEQQAPPTPLPCAQPYIWQNAETNEVILSCQPIQLGQSTTIYR